MSKTKEQLINETVTFDGQPKLSGEDGNYYYMRLLDGVEIKCLAFNGDGHLVGGGTTLKDKDATLDCFIGEGHWFLHSIYNDGDVFGVKLFNFKQASIVIDHTNPNAIDVLQQLLAARWRPNPLKEDEA